MEKLKNKPVKENNEYKSLFICGHCGKDTTNSKVKTEKVIMLGYANMLCFSCKCHFENSIEDVARKYLGKC